jgi:hypothetical protein
MRTCLVLTALATLLPASGFAQQMDMQAMAKWAAADEVRYHVVGVYQGAHHVASDGSGMADLGDRVILDFTWKLSEAKLVGKPTFQNASTTVARLRDREPACLPPVLQGTLELFELLGVKEGLGGALEFTVRTTYPAVEVAQSCTASRKTVPGKVVTEPMDFAVVSPTLFAMPLPPSDDLAVSPDRKSFVVRKQGWTWTLTPSIAAR